MKKRIFSLCVVFILLFTMLPLEALAVKDVDEAKIYTDYLLDGGYEEIFDYEISKEYMEISTCLIDLNKDGVSELLIALTDTEWGGPRGYACDSALLTIEGKTVKNLHSAYYGGGTMGGDNLVLKYDKEQQEYVAALDGYLSDGVYALFDYIYVYSAEDFSEEYVLCATRYSKYEGLYDKEIKKLRSETSLYSEDETDVYSYTVNGDYVSKEKFETLSARFTDVVDPAYQMYSGTYYAPIRGYSAKKEDDSTPETDDLTDNGYAAAVRKAIEDMQAYEWGRGYGALYDVDGNGVDELLLIHTADISDDSGNYGAATVFSVYTMFAGEVVPLLEKEKLYYEAGDPWGQIGVVKKDGKQYFAAYDSNGGVDDVYWGGGGWRLYTVDKASILCTATADFTLVEDFNNEIVSAESYAMIDGKRYDYSHYEKWVDSIDEMFTIYPAEVSWAPQHEDTMTLEDLLEYLKVHPVKQNGDHAGTGETKMVVYSDYTNLSIRKGSTITLSAGILSDGELTADTSGITFQIDDPSLLSVVTTNVQDNCRYVKLNGIAEGTTTVGFYDSVTGNSANVRITVFVDNYLSYTLNNVPTQQIEKYTSNFYNINGLFIDSYEYTVNDDMSATVSFDVYNTNYSYGAVEVLDENGKLQEAVLINKMVSSNTGVKEAVLDNLGYLVRDLIQGDMLTYRQESGFSKKTPVTVKVPKNGYVKICMDPENSAIVGLVNYADLLLSILEFSGEINDFSAKSKEYADKVTAKIANEAIFAELANDGDEMVQKLWENVGKEALITSEGMGNFVDTAIKNLNEFDLMDVIISTAFDCGWSIGEKVFTDLAGPFGVALKVIFTLGKAENVIIQYHDVTNSAGQGSIFIQNQGGGLRSCQQIKVESKTGFSDDTALNVFTVTLDSSILDVIQSLDPDIYEKMMDGVTYTYNISLLKDGAETQPNGMVTVYIPIPEDLKVLAYASMVAGNVTGKVSIYRMEEDGSLTEMDVRIEDGCFVFTTDHFSLYTIVGPDYGAKFNSNVWMIILFVAGFGCILPAILLFKKKKYVPTAILIVVGIVLLTIGAGSRLLADPQRGEDTVDETTVQTLPAEVDEQPTEAQTESPTEAPTQAEAELTPLEYWIEYCDTRNLTQEDLETFDAATCRLARNAIFAKSGRQFADASLQTFYEQFDWYDPTVPPDDFTDDMLNQYQVYNKDLIVKYEESCGYR